MKINIVQHKTKPGILPNQAQLDSLLRKSQMLAAAAVSGVAAKKTQWFGEFGNQKSGEIDSRAQKISTYLATLKYITFSCSNEKDSIAAYNQKTLEKVDGGASKLDANPTIILGEGFHMEKYNEDEKVCSLLHEFTHMTIGTLDQNDKALGDIYGDKKCLEFAQKHSADAYRNADNWAYYLCSYKDKIKA
jgi:hypothetical protein